MDQEASAAKLRLGGKGGRNPCVSCRGKAITVLSASQHLGMERVGNTEQHVGASCRRASSQMQGEKRKDAIAVQLLGNS